MADPIRYSDLIQPDDSIERAIGQLEDLLRSYNTLAKSLREEASKTKQALDNMNTSTDNGKEATRKAAAEVDKLAKAMKDLQEAQTREAAELARIKMEKAEIEKLRKVEIQLVQSEAGSLKELEAMYKANREQLDSMGSAERGVTEASKRLIAETNALHLRIKELNAETDKHTRTLSQQQKIELAVAAQKEKNTALIKGERDELIQMYEENRKLNLERKHELSISTAQEGSYNQMAALYAKNAAALANMSNVTDDANLEARALIDTNAELYRKMKEIQELQGRHTLSVGNYGKAWNGLSNSVNQLVREFPNLAVSANTFFLAISNNIPILFDEIKALKEKNETLKEMGKTTVPVGKQIAKAIFSWNTAMMAGVAILTIFGKEIVDWTKSIIKGKEATEEMKKAQSSYNDAVRDGIKKSKDNTVSLKLLYNVSQDTTKSINERRKAADKLKDSYPKYFSNFTTEEILLGKSKTAYDNLSASIIKYARSLALLDKIKENEKRKEDIKSEIETKKKELETAFGKDGFFNSIILQSKTAQDAMLINEALMPNKFLKGVMSSVRESVTPIGRATSAIKSLTDEMTALDAANKKLTDEAAAGLLMDDPTAKTGGGGGGEGISEESYAKRSLAISMALAKSQTEMLQSEYEKRRRALKDSFDYETEELRIKAKNDPELLEKVNQTVLNLRQVYFDDLRKIDLEEEAEIQERTQSYISLRLDAVKKGTEEELKLRLDMLEVQHEAEITKNNMLSEQYRQSEIAINQKYTALKYELTDKAQYEIASRELKIQQDLQESKFDYIRSTAAQETEMMLGFEIERLEMLLRLNADANEKMSDAEVQTIVNTIARLKNEIEKAKSDEPLSIYDMLGLGLDDNQKSAMDKAKDYILDNIREIMDAYVDLSEAKVEAQEEEVSKAEEAVDREIDARNAGYASDVEGAQRKLDEEKRILDEAQKEKQKALKAQQALDTAMQVSSLITASANIWKSLSSIPYIGYILAAAAVAGMFASFAASKVKASQAAKVQYGEGGMEFLEGGSHASGNDIPIGTTSDGRRRTAEGGEALAIINKRSTAKYRSVLPSLIKSLNNGTYETSGVSKYPDVTGITLVNNSTDISGLSDDVRKISKGVSTKVYTDSAGRTVIVNGNTTTRILH